MEGSALKYATPEQRRDLLKLNVESFVEVVWVLAGHDYRGSADMLLEASEMLVAESERDRMIAKRRAKEKRDAASA